jgi:hypothetical protein
MHVATPKTFEQLDNEARSIATIIAETRVDQREKLFNAISYHLTHIHEQGFTGGLFEKIALVS